jgi:hypothetical protein
VVDDPEAHALNLSPPVFLAPGAAVAGGILLAALIRRSSAPRQRFIRITAGLTALSCGAPLAFADTTASKIALVMLRLLAAAIIVPALARHANGPDLTSYDKEQPRCRNT